MGSLKNSMNLIYMMAARLRYSCAISPGKFYTSFMNPIFHKLILSSTFLLKF